MNFSKKIRNLSVLALLFASAFLTFYSVGGEKLRASTSAPLGASGTTVILQADGGAPPPPPPPPTKPQNSASPA
jgi:hypothetical protein